MISFEYRGREWVVDNINLSGAYKMYFWDAGTLPEDTIQVTELPKDAVKIPNLKRDIHPAIDKYLKEQENK